jgi:hypothetical protein
VRLRQGVDDRREHDVGRRRHAGTRQDMAIASPNRIKDAGGEPLRVPDG